MSESWHDKHNINSILFLLFLQKTMNHCSDAYGIWCGGKSQCSYTFKSHFLYFEKQTSNQLYNLLLNLQKPTFTSSGLYWFTDHFLLSPCIQVLMTLHCNYIIITALYMAQICNIHMFSYFYIYASRLLLTLTLSMSRSRYFVQISPCCYE